jgi:hypothetical protein
LEYEFHHAANLFPLMEECDPEGFKTLVGDIRKNGLLLSIVLYEGKILDGRNRYQACKAAGITPNFSDWNKLSTKYEHNISPLEYVISKNLYRRHLTDDQRAAVASEMVPMLAEEAKKRMLAGVNPDPKSDQGRAPQSDQIASGLMKVSKHKVQKASALKKANPKSFADVKSGKTKLREIKEPFVPKTAAPRPPSSKPRKPKPDHTPTASDIMDEDCPDCRTEEERWQTSCANFASYAATMRAYWKRQFGDWQKFEIPSALVMLANEAAETWAQLARELKERSLKRAAEALQMPRQPLDHQTGAPSNDQGRPHVLSQKARPSANSVWPSAAPSFLPAAHNPPFPLTPASSTPIGVLGLAIFFSGRPSPRPPSSPSIPPPSRGRATCCSGRKTSPSSHHPFRRRNSRRWKSRRRRRQIHAFRVLLSSVLASPQSKSVASGGLSASPLFRSRSMSIS